MIKRNIFIIIGFFIFNTLIFPQSITVTEPDPGETWYKGSTYDIKWTSSGCTDNSIKINIFKNSIVQSNFVEQLTSTDTGSKSWTIPNSYVTGNYVIRAKTADDICKGDSGVFKIADDPTPEATITVTSPAKDNKWEKGTEYKIEWDKSGTMGTSVKLTLHKYYTTTGVSSDIARTIAASTPNDGKFRWKIPTITLTGTYVIKVKTTDSLVTGDSEKFSIINPPPTIVQPSTPRFTAPSKTAYTAIKVLNRRKYTKPDFSKPDLKVSIDFDPGTTWVGKSTKIKFTVQNVGTKTSKTTLLKVATDNYIDEWHVTNLKPFEKFTKTITWTMKTIEKLSWLARVDTKNRMGDTNRKNNQARKDLTVNGPDLIVCIKHNNIGLVGLVATIHTKVKNVGEAPSKSCKLKISFSRRTTKYYTVPALLPGKIHLLTIKDIWIVGGDIKISASVDTKSQVIELKENNNNVKSKLSLLSIPDFLGVTSYIRRCSDGSK